MTQIHPPFAEFKVHHTPGESWNAVLKFALSGHRNWHLSELCPDSLEECLHLKAVAVSSSGLERSSVILKYYPKTCFQSVSAAVKHECHHSGDHSFETQVSSLKFQDVAENTKITLKKAINETHHYIKRRGCFTCMAQSCC